ncbi:MAG: alpha-ketoglutarate-dependent dioxygenase AlkB [Gammaproteobacteria bacterium]|nr:alpha-ketoglutarate-dependent dioxygenase AlkB [Gammaproteobacteria bacterium]MYD76829.1 alpha-ketoglutarate-dependent dioxygenase AlkB [Gammaproteobacteria bacterium]MYJ51408.1 alpha-ketoglutarate-dependent dioxygenase AlkB [Gammaproteobacteria bacterium]
MTERVDVIPGECVLFNRFIEADESQRILESLTCEITWQQHKVRVFNRVHSVPRLTAWYGDKGTVYGYSGSVHHPLPWIPVLTGIRRRVEDFLGRPFNSVLLNLYRNGSDTMGRHSDDEPELGDNPVIASVSFGGSRRFVFHPKPGNPEPRVRTELDDGSLLIMHGSCQRRWKHSIPKTRNLARPRINLTFRTVLEH